MLTYSSTNDRLLPSLSNSHQYPYQKPSTPYQNLIFSALSHNSITLSNQENINPNLTYHKALPSSQANIKIEKVLDAPSILDDFYLSLMDWSILGPLGIALDNEVYLYTPQNTTKICKMLDGSYVSSVKFCGKNPLVSVGFSDGKVRIYDLEKNQLIRQLYDHQKRVSSQQFCSSTSMLLTASKDKNIFANDLTMRNPTVAVYGGHKGEICSVKEEPHQKNYFASGSNDNSVRIWDYRKTSESLYINKDHKGAVKALDWCPWKNGVIASGGGSGDRTIRIWSAVDTETLSIKKTQTQISSILWNQTLNNLISSHGCPKNELIAWKLQPNGNCAITLKQQTILKGHTNRILQMVHSHNQGLLCSISADETIRMWRIHEKSDSWMNSLNDQEKTRWSFKLK